MRRISKVLVANRGEIAVRVIRAARDAGIASVAVYADQDRDAPHARLADEAYALRGTTSAETYLVIDKILSAARRSGADAIHPGYGFLSEKADFVKMVEDENIGFVGPSSEHIRRMGDKIEAKKIAQAAGVPTVPGSDGVVTEFGEALDVAKQTGFPLLIKAAAGGGGRGMRVVESEDTLEKDLNEIMNEAQSAFNDSSVYIERFLTDIRHIEIQVLADGENAIALGERDCTSQRRNQKLIEEAPSPAIDDELRAGLQEAAINLCKEVGYKNAGTVEFVFDNIERKYYFIEMNTRIQVEHPVTEMITGVDLIQEQLRIASGQKLRLTQDDVQIRGHAIECRINAEDPNENFAPRPGKIEHYRTPGGFGVRMDTHIEAGYTIPPFYDSMVGKLICWADTRDEAIERTLRALDELKVDGVVTTAPFQAQLINSDKFRSGEFNTGYVAKMLENMDTIPTDE